MKVSNTDGYTREHESRALVACNQGYMLNVPNKRSTVAWCECKDNICGWQFNRGHVMCVPCIKPTSTRGKGKGVAAFKDKIINVSV